MLPSNTAARPLFSVLKSAQFCYCIPRQFTIPLNQYYNKGINTSMLRGEYLSLLSVLVINHCRISELLQLKFCDVLAYDTVLCRGKKHSQSFTLWLPDITRQIDKFPDKSPDNKIFSVKYIEIYRICRKAGLRLSIPGRKNDRVTHASRYVVANRVMAISNSDQAGECLHHKSRRSILHYIY